MLDIEIAEIIETIPYAFWKSFSYQQINKRKDLKPPRWSILVNDNGVQCSLFWPGNEAPDLVTQLDNTDEAQGVDDREKTVNLTPTEAPVDINPSDSDISDLIQNVLKRHCTSLGVAALDGEEQTTQPKKIRKKSTPVKTDYTRLPTHSFLGSGNTSSGPCTPVPVGVATISNLSTPAASVASHSSPITPTVKQEPFGPNEASKRLMELSSKHFQHKNSDDSTPGPFGNSLLNMAKAAQQKIEIEEVGSLSPDLNHTSMVNFNNPSSMVKDLSSEKIEKIAHETGTFQTLQKMRNEAERGTLNLSKAVRLLARCLFNEDELVVESIKDLDQNKVDLLHAETARWYNCTMTEVRQVMSFRLSEIRKTKRASHWAKRTPFASNSLTIPYTDNNQFILPKISNSGAFTNQDLIKKLNALNESNSKNKDGNISSMNRVSLTNPNH